MFKVIKEVGLVRFVKAGLAEIYRITYRQLLRNSYSQNWEDIIIDRLLKNKNNGFYLEIGGYEPKRLSNTYRFYKRGWRGIVVEPNPDVKDKFVSSRPGDIFINTGIGANNDYLNYYKYLVPALNTFSKKTVKDNTQKGFNVTEIKKIKIIDIKTFLKKYVVKDFDILSIDTEGLDYEILKNWNWEYKPQIICCEKDDENQISYLLAKYGYVVSFQTKYNLIYISR